MRFFSDFESGQIALKSSAANFFPKKYGPNLGKKDGLFMDLKFPAKNKPTLHISYVHLKMLDFLGYLMRLEYLKTTQRSKSEN